MLVPYRVLRLFSTKLLTRDPSKRLGSSPDDALEVQRHPFFAPLDWERIMRREVSSYHIYPCLAIGRAQPSIFIDHTIICQNTFCCHNRCTDEGIVDSASEACARRHTFRKM